MRRIYPGEQGGEEGKGLAADKLVGVAQAGRQARHVRVHQRSVLHCEICQRHHDVVANLRPHACFKNGRPAAAHALSQQAFVKHPQV